MAAVSRGTFDLAELPRTLEISELTKSAAARSDFSSSGSQTSGMSCPLIWTLMFCKELNLSSLLFSFDKIDDQP